MALFKRKKVDRRAQEWGWDPANANLTGEQAWALLTNAIYFRSVAPRLDTLGGGLDNMDWVEGLSTWWEVHNEEQFDELVEWMQVEGFRSKWASDGVDDGDEKLAWDYCRLITVTGGAALAQMVPGDKAWELVMHASDRLFDRFDSWASLADNYLSARILWLDGNGHWTPTPDPSQAQFQTTANLLLNDPDSPWSRVDWDRSNGVYIDGELVT